MYSMSESDRDCQALAPGGPGRDYQALAPMGGPGRDYQALAPGWAGERLSAFGIWKKIE